MQGSSRQHGSAMPADSDPAPPTVLLNGAVLYESVLDAGSTVFETEHAPRRAGCRTAPTVAGSRLRSGKLYRARSRLLLCQKSWRKLAKIFRKFAEFNRSSDKFSTKKFGIRAQVAEGGHPVDEVSFFLSPFHTSGLWRADYIL